MNKGHNSSYEGFRRKNSLNSHDIAKNNTSIDSVYPKIKKQDLKLVENLSMELQNISKRSLTSRSYVQNNKYHTQSCHSINIYNQEVVQKEPLNKHKVEISSFKKISFEPHQDQLDLSEIKKQKTANSLAFNHFDTIQETRSFCQEEIIDDISPVTLKHSYHESTTKNKITNKLVPKVEATRRTVYKKATIKTEAYNPKDKIRHDLSQLDKMQKELDIKKINRETGDKLFSSSTGVKRAKNMVNPTKETPKIRLLAQNDVKIQNLKASNVKSSKNLIPQQQKIETKPSVLNLQKTEQKLQSQQMAATRMLSQKQKGHLVGRLLELRSIIEKNQICSDSNEEIVFHLKSIEKLLTH